MKWQPKKNELAWVSLDHSKAFKRCRVICASLHRPNYFAIRVDGDHKFLIRQVPRAQLRPIQSPTGATP